MKNSIMETHPQITLIVVNYRSAEYLAKALESLFSFEEERAFFEVIVVNNDPKESSALVILQQRFPLQIIESDDNIGFGAGNNRGVKLATGRILGFINPDTLWIGAYLRNIVRTFDEKKEIGILGMEMRDTDGREEMWSAGRAPSLVNLFLNNIIPARQAYWKKSGLSFPDRVSGGALFIRKDLFDDLGGFDEAFFLYFEDVDLCTRVREQGFLVARDTATPIVHLGGKSKASVMDQKKYFYASQRIYYKKHRPLWEGVILEVLQFFFCRKRV